MRSVNQRRSARLISAAIALALIWASTIGAYAHALAHCHHGHAHVAQPQDFRVAPAAIDMEHKGESKKAPARNHADCCDTICHGGYAIVDEVSPVLPLPQAKPPIPVMRADAGAGPHSLDRPPRSPILA
jgi:hypothetical protein